MAKQRKWHSPISSGTYGSWRAMLGRCLDPNNVAYRYYGARGITVCTEWVDNYDQFYADMGERPTGLTLDRKDSNLGYSPANCRWATRKEQLNNQRRTIEITHEGTTLTLSQWAERLGVPYFTLWNRIALHKMEPAKALTPQSLIIPWRHGTITGYSRGCRCALCKEVSAEYRLRRRNVQAA